MTRKQRIYVLWSVLIVAVIGLAAILAEVYLDPAEVCDWGLRGRC